MKTYKAGSIELTQSILGDFWLSLMANPMSFIAKQEETQ